MKKLLPLMASFLGMNAVFAQDVDTLKNFTGNVTLEVGRYSGSDWGFFAGHNSKEQQQFGEKYLVADHVHVLGVVAHLTTSTGTVTDPDFEIDFRLWPSGANGQPAGTSSIEDGHLDLGDANLGGATVVMFHDEKHVDTAFFVTMDLGDYAHDGLAGDTVGLYYAPHGTRTATDIANVPFRNVFQPHSHGNPVWRDFYTQFTTPLQIATHLALYPIVELEELSVGGVTKNGLSINAPYPNPATHLLNVPFTLTKGAEVSMQIMDLNGRIISNFEKMNLATGTHTKSIDVQSLPVGAYILTILSTEGAMGLKFNKI